MQTLGDVITWTLAIVGAILIPYLIIRAWVFPHARTIWASVRAWLMSNGEAGESEYQASDQPNQQQAIGNNHPIAMGSNAVNGELTVNDGDSKAVNQQSDFVPAEAREVIRFQAKAEAIADLIREGIVTNQAKAIETVYHCSRTSSKRPDTPYQKARTLIESILNSRPIYYDDLRAKIATEVRAEEKPEEVEA